VIRKVEPPLADGHDLRMLFVETLVGCGARITRFPGRHPDQLSDTGAACVEPLDEPGKLSWIGNEFLRTIR
jgi:hypothetical protein